MMNWLESVWPKVKLVAWVVAIMVSGVIVWEGAQDWRFLHQARKANEARIAADAVIQAAQAQQKQAQPGPKAPDAPKPSPE